MLYPRLDLAFRQVGHFWNWDALIEPQMAAMPEINRQIDAILPKGRSPAYEVAFVQQWVYKMVPYKYDWYQWGNVDYWPTATEVWEARQEDCDGQAILAASILRSRGFTTARLAVNLQHVWVVVETNDPKLKAPKPLASMSPMKNENVARTNSGKLRLQLPDKETILGTLHLIPDFPVWRLILLLLWPIFVWRPSVIYPFWASKPRPTA